MIIYTIPNADTFRSKKAPTIPMIPDQSNNQSSCRPSITTPRDGSPANRFAWLNISLSEILYYPTLFFYVAWRVTMTSMLAFPSGSTVNSRIHACLIVVFVLSLLLRKSNSINILCGIVLAGVGYLVKIKSGDAYIFDLMVVLCCSHGMDLRRIATTCFIAILSTCMICVALSQIGMIQDYIVYRGSAIRHSLGFLYCTYLGHYYLSIVLLYLYIRDNKLHWYEYVAMMALDFFIYTYTDARNPFFLALAALTLSLLLRLAPLGFAKILETIAAWIYPLLFCLSLFLTLAYNPYSNAWNSLNTLLTNRLQQTQTTFSEYPLSLFGNSVHINGNGLVMTESGPQKGQTIKPNDSNDYVDNSWISLLVKAGIVATIAMLAMSTCAGAWSLTANRPIFAIICITTAVHVFFDDQFVSLAYTPFLFYFWDCMIYYLDRFTTRNMSDPGSGM